MDSAFPSRSGAAAANSTGNWRTSSISPPLICQIPIRLDVMSPFSSQSRSVACPSKSIATPLRIAASAAATPSAEAA